MAKAKRKSTSGKRRKSKKSSNSQDLNLNIIGTIIFSVLLAIIHKFRNFRTDLK